MKQRTATVGFVRPPVELTHAFRQQGLKLTPQRQLLFRLLHGHEGHPTADALFADAAAQMPGISRRTVYQTLNDLVAMGELRVLTFTAGPNRFDPNVDLHHHAECVACGELRDIRVPGVSELELHGLYDFHPHQSSLVVSGFCTPCATVHDPNRATTTTNHTITQGSTT
jgi:Fur family transcriptional regulator, stress-responsive regulator